MKGFPFPYLHYDKLKKRCYVSGIRILETHFLTVKSHFFTLLSLQLCDLHIPNIQLVDNTWTE